MIPALENVVNLALRYDIQGHACYDPIEIAPRKYSIMQDRLHVQAYIHPSTITVPVYRVQFWQDIRDSQTHKTWTYHATLAVGLVPWSTVYYKLKLHRRDDIVRVRLYGTPKNSWRPGYQPRFMPGVGWVFVINN